MRLEYSALGAPDLRGRTEAEVFVHVEADLVVSDGGEEICTEGAFPVVELAAALREWQAQDERRDFEFPSLSLDGRWEVRIVRVSGGWQVAAEAVRGAARPLAEIDAAVDEFVETLRADCTRQFGSWIDQYFPPGATPMRVSGIVEPRDPVVSGDPTTPFSVAWLPVGAAGMGLDVYRENQVHDRVHAGREVNLSLTRVLAEAQPADLLHGVDYHGDTMFNVGQLRKIDKEFDAILARRPELASDVAALRTLFELVVRDRGYLWIAGD
ncbi:hypothetical protein [Amycolatopsis sacchari]|uniref:DUF7878 domain-containing protein n=1 Tax=Amycolatopsis sacchari TaxID=115433 RepID=UPI003EBB26E5